MDIKKIRKDFPMLNGKKMQGKPLVFLDNASTTFKPNCVIEAMDRYYLEENSNSGRGDYDLMYKVDQTISEARNEVAKFINANTDEIVFVNNDTEALNLVVFGYFKNILKKGDEILLTLAEHASNVLPWFKLQKEIGCKVKFIPLTEEGKITPENLKKSITGATKVVSIANISNVLGYVNDIKSLTKVAHENGVLVVCDGAQSVPHIKTDVKDCDVDFLAFSGHKMCGPTGIGILYGKRELLENTEPLILGGGMNVSFEIDGEYVLQKSPIKFEAGTHNISAIYGLKAAISYLNNIGMDNISNYEKELKTYAIQRMKEVKDIVIYNEKAESGIISFNLKGVFAQDLATLLNSKGIAVRSGNHCAKILKNQINEIATVRASIYFYNTKEEIDTLVDALKEGGNFLDAYFA